VRSISDGKDGWRANAGNHRGSIRLLRELLIRNTYEFIGTE
jgi:hypothetical protein